MTRLAPCVRYMLAHREPVPEPCVCARRRSLDMKALLTTLLTTATPVSAGDINSCTWLAMPA